MRILVVQESDWLKRNPHQQHHLMERLNAESTRTQGKTCVIGAGIDLARFNPELDGHEIREAYGLKKEDIVLFFMGWLYHFAGLKEVALELANKKEYMAMGKPVITTRLPV